MNLKTCKFLLHKHLRISAPPETPENRRFFCFLCLFSFGPRPPAGKPAYHPAGKLRPFMQSLRTTGAVKRN